ncbi:MAG: rRNA maturation RNase YbeY [bacterium]|nr:rRNA maturation RNase YbeY [bacterium]
MELRIFKETEVRLPRKNITRLFELVAEEEAEPDSRSSTNLIFVTNQRIKNLNSRFRGKTAATDVLSFNIDEPNDEDGTFGEVYISVPFARRQAKEYGGSLSEEILRLACHGFLHLFGYDHIRPDDERVMKKQEAKFLSKVYAL